jgi:hypothetical protein
VPFALRLMSMSRFNSVTDIAGCGRRVRFERRDWAAGCHDRECDQACEGLNS